MKIMNNFCQLWLTCADEAEATKIASVLLHKKLIVCAKQLPIISDFLWKSKIDHNDEVLMVMDSREDLFKEVEAEVAQIHSYETFALQSVAIANVSDKAAKWMKENLKQETSTRTR